MCKVVHVWVILGLIHVCVRCVIIQGMLSGLSAGLTRRCCLWCAFTPPPPKKKIKLILCLDSSHMVCDDPYPLTTGRRCSLG